MSIAKLKTKFFTGAFLVDVKHYFDKINEIIDYLNGIGKSGDGSYKVYTALLSHPGGYVVPDVIVLNNTLGFVPTYQYSDPGEYIVNSVIGFPAHKTTVTLSQYVNILMSGVIVDTSRINISSQDLITGIPVANDGLMSDTLLEIKVYN